MPYFFYSPVQIYAKLLFFHACDQKMKNIKILRFRTNIQTDLLSRLNARRPYLPPFDAVMVISQRHVFLRFEQKLQLQRIMFTQSRFAH